MTLSGLGVKRAILALAILSSTLAAPPVSAGPEDQLFEAIENDPSFKVRMQAIRVLTKRIIAQKRPAAEKALAVLGKAATDDDAYLVRGLACFSLGQLGDTRVRAALEQARSDSHTFVREQAEEALRQLPTSGPEPGVVLNTLPLPDRPGGHSGSPLPEMPGGARLLVVNVEQSADSSGSRELVDRLRSTLDEQVRKAAGSRFVIGRRSDVRGFVLAGSVADRRIEAAQPGKVRVTMVVRITISTWPENHLRHVVTARATAETVSTSESGRGRLEQRVLEAAVKQATQEAMTEITREN